VRVAAADSPVIVADHLWKSYRPQTHQISLRHEALKMLRQPFHRPAAPTHDLFWALQDITFTIRAGEAVALVGRNGSGKTTLLRVLCGITRPARGHFSVNGRFATLIALGAGFNLERTGRENVFLNAAIQGVPPKQVSGLLGDIVEFAELGEFIDVPVKRYSSGMVTRLGFSIAVHILPEIIFIDEVLAVGDAAFQHKCIERILQMKAEGRTLMFVSHAPDTIRQVCERAIWLHGGRLRKDGPVDDVLGAYEAFVQAQATEGHHPAAQ
jgi:ABC-type polysaccharide/polyol phosphate transport system ATPase subunit